MRRTGAYRLSRPGLDAEELVKKLSATQLPWSRPKREGTILPTLMPIPLLAPPARSRAVCLTHRAGSAGDRSRRV